MKFHSAGTRLVLAAGLAAAGLGVQTIGQTVRLGPATGVSTQDPAAPAPVGTGVILGQVVDASSGRPIGDVAVTIAGGTSTTILGAGDVMTTVSPAGSGSSGAPRQVLTNAQGQFVFHSLSKGLYGIRANSPGYVLGGPGQHRPNGPMQPIILVADDTKVDAVVVRMWKIASITGTVVDEAGEPIVGLSISAMRRTTVNGQVRFASQSTASTDDRGIYRVSVTPGDYIVTTQSTQTTLPVSVADAYVQAMSAGGSITTSDVYRNLSSSGVQPSMSGYRVGDQLFQGGGVGRGGAAAPAAAEDAKPYIYPSTAYPSATSMAQGTVITVGSGENRSAVDLHLKLMPTVRVSGTVTGPDGPGRNLGVKLFTPGADAITGLIQNQESASTATDANGVFTFLGVTPGRYTLKIVRVPRPLPVPMNSSNSTTIEVSAPGGGMMMMGMVSGGPTAPPPPPIPAEPTLWATMPVTVGDNDVTGLNVPLRPGARISGRVQFEGTQPPPSPEQLVRTNISLTSNEPRSFAVPIPIVRVDAEGRFTSGGFTAGRYQVSGNVPSMQMGMAGPGFPSGWTFKSATLNGKNLADDPLEIDGDDISGVVVTFTDRTSSLGGTVTDATGKPDSAAEVVIFPADSQGWRQGLPNTRRIRVGRVSQTGSYEFGNLPAGDYHAAAIGSASVGDPQDPKFLEKVVPLATKVTVGDGDKRVENLTTKVVR